MRIVPFEQLFFLLICSIGVALKQEQLNLREGCYYLAIYKKKQTA